MYLSGREFLVRMQIKDDFENLEVSYKMRLPNVQHWEKEIFLSDDGRTIAKSSILTTKPAVSQKIWLWDAVVGYRKGVLVCNYQMYGFMRNIAFIHKDSKIITSSARVILIWDYKTKSVLKVMDEYGGKFQFIPRLNKLLVYDPC